MKPSQPNDPQQPPSTEPNESLIPLSDSERIERLTLLVESLSEQLALAEARVAQLTAAVEESAEDLQEFGGCFIKPSTVGIIGYTMSSAEVTLNGAEMQRKSSIPPHVWTYMESLARNINKQNSAKRKAAGLAEPEPMNLPDLPNLPEGTP